MNLDDVYPELETTEVAYKRKLFIAILPAVIQTMGVDCSGVDIINEVISLTSIAYEEYIKL